MLSEQHHLPVENLLTPDFLRRVLWTPPATREPAALRTAVVAALADLGARPWQVDLTADIVVAAVLEADRQPEVPDAPGAPDAPADDRPTAE